MNARHIPVIALIALAVSVVAVQSCSASIITVAHGDPLIYNGTDAPYYIVVGSDRWSQDLTDVSNATGYIQASAANYTGVGQTWVFGESDTILALPFTFYRDHYSVYISKSDIETMASGDYDMYLQFPGPDGTLAFSYDTPSEMFNSTFTGFPTSSTVAMSPYLIEESFLSIKDKYRMDDQFNHYKLNIGDPRISVTTNYNINDGDMVLRGVTNLAVGDQITAQIDPDVYKTPEYIYMMSASCNVTPGDYENRQWSLIFPGKVTPQLSASTHHTIDILLPGGYHYSIPFGVGAAIVTPVIPVEQDYYFMINRTYNNSAPERVPTPVATYKTVTADIHYNNRTIDNWGTVYVGEMNLDIHKAIGWADLTSGDWYIQYCDNYNAADYGRIVQISDPYHFDIDRSTFQTSYGSWCQYNKELDDDNKQPVAFLVRKPVLNMTEYYVNAYGDIVAFNDSDVEPLVTIGNVSTETPTMTPITDTETITTPTPLPTDSNVVQQPLPAWIAIIAIALGALICRR